MLNYVHGGDIQTYIDRHGFAPLDLSANINPFGIPDAVRAAMHRAVDNCTQYPDPFCRAARQAIGAREGVNPDFLYCGNGAADVLDRLAAVLKPRKVLLTAPTFAEYERTLSGAEIRVHNQRKTDGFALTERILDEISPDLDAVYLCNPNNPTSSAILKDEMRALLSFCANRDIFVMIDETYVEFAPSVQEVTAVPYTKEFSNLMVLRGVSKFYAAPGMRFGYGITGNKEFLSQMKEKQIPWSLNSLGAYAGEQMFKDTSYIRQTRALILTERDRIFLELKKMSSFKVYFPYGNFILVKILKPEVTSFDVFEACIKEGLMIRDCSSFQCLDGEFIRFCIMKPEDNDRLLKVLKTI